MGVAAKGLVCNVTACMAWHCRKNELNDSASQSTFSTRSLSGAATKRGSEVGNRSSASTRSARRATLSKLSMGPATKTRLTFEGSLPINNFFSRTEELLTPNSLHISASNSVGLRSPNSQACSNWSNLWSSVWPKILTSAAFK